MDSRDCDALAAAISTNIPSSATPYTDQMVALQPITPKPSKTIWFQTYKKCKKRIQQPLVTSAHVLQNLMKPIKIGLRPITKNPNFGNQPAPTIRSPYDQYLKTLQNIE